MIPLATVRTALTRLEQEHAYGYPEFWDYLDDAVTVHNAQLDQALDAEHQRGSGEVT